MQWYIPITILPGISLLILSTSNLLLDINQEIKELKSSEEDCQNIIQMKLLQLKRLSWAISGLYVTVLFLTFSGLAASVQQIGLRVDKISLVFLIVGIVVVIILLIVYAIRAVSIRMEYLKI